LANAPSHTTTAPAIPALEAGGRYRSPRSTHSKERKQVLELLASSFPLGCFVSQARRLLSSSSSLMSCFRATPSPRHGRGHRVVAVAQGSERGRCRGGGHAGAN
jgi:hypothetical protein